MLRKIHETAKTYFFLAFRECTALRRTQFIPDALQDLNLVPTAFPPPFIYTLFQQFRLLDVPVGFGH